MPQLPTPARRPLLVCAFLACVALPARAADVTLSETGSTLLYPLLQTWVAAYVGTHPGVRIATAATGSEAGLREALAGTVQIGMSDAFLSDAEMRQHPDMLNIPLAISALSVSYNLPGWQGPALRLDGPALAGIYRGTIRTWDAPALAALNPGAALPHQPIVPIHRADGSGDTFVFTQFLSFSTPSWEDREGYGTGIAWPAVPGGIAAPGNDGVVAKLLATPYAVAYVGLSYGDRLSTGTIGTAALRNSDGAFVLPTREGVQEAAATLGPRTPPDERLSLAFAPGAGAYPLVNYEYAIVARTQKDAATAAALRRFLLWCIEPSEDRAAMLDTVHFIPLAPHTWELSQAQIQSIR